MRAINCCGWVLALIASMVYLLTLEPTVSFWDCGEFIATAYTLQVSHPPGAPLYQLLAHLFCLLAGGHTLWVAACCNALSAIATGLTVMFLYWTLERMLRHKDKKPQPHLGAVVGSACYLFCHTVWFSAVESEVYALAMLIAAIMIWAAYRWRDSVNSTYLPSVPAGRWLLLLALLTGMGICVHQITLLTLPMIVTIIVTTLLDSQQAGRGKERRKRKEKKKEEEEEREEKEACLPASRRKRKERKDLLNTKLLLAAMLFFAIGLTPYLIVPIRAAGHPPLNFGNPDNMERFCAYLTRESYEKAPLYPRMWRHRSHDDENAAMWSGGDNGLKGNLQYYVTYQLGYMYGRYLCDNFIARHNERRNDTVWYVLPLLIAFAGIVAMGKQRNVLFQTLILFVTAGPLLNFYLNHPCYEPRERDYAYILSFYAVALWIGYGADSMLHWTHRCWHRILAAAVIVAAPLLMACGNWDDHDRSGRWVAHDVAVNLLNSCDKDALLFSFGDNDTFPIWYVQQVEGIRTDVQCENINLIGYRHFFELLVHNRDSRPCYLTQYAYDYLHDWFGDGVLPEGMNYRIVSTTDTTDRSTARTLCDDKKITWHDTTGVFVDYIGRSFMRRERIDSLTW